MSLEENVLRLARAIEQSEGNLAVREIIRQRDEAIKRAQRAEKDLEFLRKQWNETSDRVLSYSKKLSACRGVVTRLKNRLREAKAA